MLTTIFHDDTQKNMFEFLAAIGLTTNGLAVEGVVSTSFPLKAVSIFVFGVGVIGFATIHATRHAREAVVFRPVSAVYGGLVLMLFTSSTFAYAVSIGKFDNLLAVLLLCCYAVFYWLTWSRINTMDVEQIPFTRRYHS